MGTLVVLAILFVGSIVLGFKIRKGSVEKEIRNNASYLHEYVVKKCTRNGMDHQEAQEIADNYEDDFINECGRRVNWKWGNLWEIKQFIREMQADMSSEIDARLR